MDDLIALEEWLDKLTIEDIKKLKRLWDDELKLQELLNGEKGNGKRSE